MWWKQMCERLIQWSNAVKFLDKSLSVSPGENKTKQRNKGEKNLSIIMKVYLIFFNNYNKYTNKNKIFFWKVLWKVMCVIYIEIWFFKPMSI